MLSLWVQDHGVYGMIVVVAQNEENARIAMSICLNYSANEPVASYSITEGRMLYNLGDL